MKRYVGAVLAALVAVAGLLWPLLDQGGGGASGSDPVTITDYRVGYTVDEAGTLLATETVVTAMPGDRHGIFRFWDVRDASDPHARLVPEDVTVTLDGGDVPVDLSWENHHRYVVAKVGDPDAYVPQGSHTYVITYRIDGVLAGDGTGGSLFYWDMVPAGWRMAIEQSQTSVTLPAPGTAVRCEVGFAGVPCDVSGAGTTTLTVSTGRLSPNTPVTVRTDVAVPAPERVTRPWPVQYDGILGRSVPFAVVLVLLAVAGLAVGTWLARRSRERSPGFPVMYAPVAGLGPAQHAYVATEDVSDDAMAATLLYQAEQGLTRLTPVDAKRWVIEGTGDDAAWRATDPVTRGLGQALGVVRPGNQFYADGTVSAGETLKSATAIVASDTRSWARSSGMLATVDSEVVAKGLVYVAGVLAIVCFWWNPWDVTLMGLPFAAFVVAGFPLVLTGVGTRRTAAGRDLWSRAGGFRRMLSTPSAEQRFEFSARRELYTAYIPFAVAFGCADDWAEKYETEMGEPAPMPVWFYGGGVHTFRSTSAAVAGFQSSLAGSISAYQATQSSSGGGGGFSGGGGGGGGGGSW